MVLKKRIHYEGYRKPNEYPRGYRGKPKHINISRKSRDMQRWNLKNPWIRPLCAFNLAAVIIQNT